jgi:3'-5' exoribonuclease 1
MSQEEKSDKIYFCILDFEATCEKDVEIRPREIIEFPSVLYCYEEGKLSLIDKFESFVRPTCKSILSKFCTDLTGITQKQVDAANTLDIVYKKHYSWLEPIARGYPLIFVTCGDWDLAIQLPFECKLKNIKYKIAYSKFINIKNCFAKTYKFKPKSYSLANMLDAVGIKFVGHQHSGIDDCINTGLLFERLYLDGYRYEI